MLVLSKLVSVQQIYCSFIAYEKSWLRQCKSTNELIFTCDDGHAAVLLALLVHLAVVVVVDEVLVAGGGAERHRPLRLDALLTAHRCRILL